MKVTLASIAVILAILFLVLSIYSTVPLWISIACLCVAVLFAIAPIPG